MLSLGGGPVERYSEMAFDLAAAVIVLRIVVERAGAPASVSNLFSVVALHTVIVPIYIAVRLGKSGKPITNIALQYLYRSNYRLMW
jgi:hypothetical protein